MTQTFPGPNAQNDTHGHISHGYAKSTAISVTSQPTDVIHSRNTVAMPLPQSLPTPSVRPEKPGKFRRVQGLQGWSLKTKAILAAIALSVLPIAGIGGISYYFSNRAVTAEIINEKQARIAIVTSLIHRFLEERYGDMQALSSLPILRNLTVQAALTIQERQAVLNSYLRAYQVYNSIAAFDLNGNVTLQTAGSAAPNQKNLPYFQQVLQTGSGVIGAPEKLPDGGIVINVAEPIKNAAGQMIGVVRGQIPGSALEDLLQVSGADQSEYHLMDGNGEFFIALEKSQVGRQASEDFPKLEPLIAGRQTGSLVSIDKIDNAEQLATYAPIEDVAGVPPLNWSTVLAEDTRIVFASQRQLALILEAGIALTVLGAGTIATFVVARATRPLLAASNTVEKIGRGELNARLAIQGSDELAQLGSNVNTMAMQLETLVQDQTAAAEESYLLATIAGLRVIDLSELRLLFDQAMDGARELLHADRVVIYRFNPDWSGYIAAESVLPGWTRTLNDQIGDACIPQELLEAYRQGRVVPTNNVFNAGFHPEHVQLMKRLQIKANLVVPIAQQDRLYGLLIAHHCAHSHIWQDKEVEFMKRLSERLSVALDRLAFLGQIQESQQKAQELAEEQRQLKEDLQKRALKLLIQVDPVSKGDLTVRAKVTEDEIGTVADSYNAIIESLRRIVLQVQKAAQQVTVTTGVNETSVQLLSAGAIKQTAEITAALNQVQQMAQSIQLVAVSAQQAEAAVQQAALTVQAGDTAMNRTVEGILAIRETVGETAKKVKRLGESSQKISKVVNLISTFAAQTNLLALNASIEAARAGEEGRGFAVVADEVRLLARQSAEATAEIEKLVVSIQAETNEVVSAMEAGTEQVVAGTQLVDETRQSLNDIAAASTQINELVNAITQAALEQSRASESVTQTMTGVSAIADQTSTQAAQVSDSFRELLSVATALQEEVGQFKIR